MSSTGLSAVTAGSSLLADSYFMSEPYTKGFLEYTLPANTSLGGVVLWAPDANNYGGGDGPVKDFRVEVIYNNVVTYTSQTFTTAQPIGDGANRGAQVFYLGKTFANPQKVRLNILSGWYDINNNSSIQVGTETIPMGTINVAYNMTLSEFKVICGPEDLDTDGDGTPNRLDLDSDNDGCLDAKEAGIATSVTSSTGVVASPYGTNGFANSLETTADNGIYSGTYTYNFASNATLNACIDTDGDGIVDGSDECPTEAGHALTDGCPDTDGDGVRDKDDKCPTQAGFAALQGCPDSDGDGIADADDKCPQQAGSASNNGCPVEEKPAPIEEKPTPTPKQVVQERLSALSKIIEFGSSSAVIRAVDFKNLDEVVALMKKNADLKLSLEGHADNTGNSSIFEMLEIGIGIFLGAITFSGSIVAFTKLQNKTYISGIFQKIIGAKNANKFFK
jgi:hypothetical protein